MFGWLLGFCRVPSRVRYLAKEVNKMSEQIEALRAQVERNTAIDTSAIELLNGLAAQISAMKDDPAALQALADEMTASSDALAAAVAANTPVT